MRVALALLMITLVPAFAAAGEAEPPAVDVGLTYAGETGGSGLRDFWERAHGVELFASAPYYAGRLRGGIRWTRTESITDAQPDFDALFAYLGWGAGVTLPGGVHWDAGIALGATEWIFEQETGTGIGLELEMGTEFYTTIQRMVSDHWGAFASASFQLTFTQRRVETGFFTVGLARRFAMPSWVMGVLY